MFTLAQQAQSKGDILPVVLWLGILIVITVVGGLIVLAIRKRILSKSSDAADEASLMDSLRAMRDRGEMTPEEFEATRRAMIERVRGTLPSMTPPKATSKSASPALHEGGSHPRPPARG